MFGEVKVEKQETYSYCMENKQDTSICGELKSRICNSCELPIKGKYLLKIHDQHWHEHCLICSICTMKLSGNCFTKEDKMFCKDDYTRLFGCKCSGCQRLISPNELVMKALHNVYHVVCFKCDECGDKLEKGDEFILKDEKLYCSSDFNVAEQKSDIDVFSSDEIDSMSATSPNSSKYDDKDSSAGCKRPRTILTTQQRADFKAAFELTPKPCRKVREQLSSDTGLSVRVVQVWFQNQRAKLKKMQKKAEEGGGSDKIKKVNNQGKVNKKKRPKSISSTKSSETSASPQQDFNLPVTAAVTSQFSEALDISDNYITVNMTNLYGNNVAHEDTLDNNNNNNNNTINNNNQNNMLTQQNNGLNLRTSYYPYARMQSNYFEQTNINAAYGNGFQIPTQVNDLTSTQVTSSHFQMMPHLMNSFI